MATAAAAAPTQSPPTSAASTVVPTSIPETSSPTKASSARQEGGGDVTAAPTASEGTESAATPSGVVAGPSSTESDQPPSASSSSSATAGPSSASTAALSAAHYAQYGPGDIQGLLPDVIDSDIFAQLLEMDDEEDHDFSKGIVWNYFDQAESTFDNMDDALATSDLGELSTLGHFLKGSSAAVGVIKVRDSCECMQHYGKMHDADGISQLTQQESVDKLTSALREVKVQYKEAEIVLRRFYDDA
ncbi:hypothetical protein A4X09_0g4350 [Tilletia walkeri]|uniref:HPt domain-containing protein n=1 Tax=Tilletia walkeri TaxID=117179 RepID=A0A8X7N913_9BASI|nr:hypothetical protein A4X09_0g4350 [Tilletia walkeri]